MISPLEIRCSASYGVKSGGSSPPAEKESPASSHAADSSPAVSSKDRGGTFEGSSPPFPSRKRVCCSEGLSLSIPGSIMAVFGEGADHASNGRRDERQKRHIVAAMALAQTRIAYLPMNDRTGKRSGEILYDNVQVVQ